MSELIVEVVRSGFVESTHRARMIAVGGDGKPVRVHGEVQTPASPRSSMKPLQALGMLSAGLNLNHELLALACGSHAGEPFHVEGARKILTDAGLDESVLRCPEDFPEDRAVQERARVYMNCSGKHAAMLATCAANDWPLDDYRDPSHPLQKTIRATVEEFTSERVPATGVDGCGAPLFFCSMTGLARAFRRIVQASPGSLERRVADAMRAHPEYTSGTHRPEAKLMRAIPGLMLKAGAEAFDAFAHEDGRAAVIKIVDGGQRARVPVTIAALRALGFDAPELDELAVPVLGGGQPVGEICVRTS
ncbi:asparaginase [Acrocarpospora phusangensis]|uniref:Asparaginase n=1 Tax=Acrocarpospora phusangensis TaxID=1070424 RepID=A0A919QKJ1_9ACTN|nr:asparaginase [Acrocarpospora phusangensis]GIH29466.1 asparaginase [Acrocarpospora phusangensis]